MKHIHKYIFATIILLLFTTTLQAAPKAFDSLGNELEALQKDCELYLKDPQVSKKWKDTCKKFNLNVDKAFKVGYPLDVSVESGNADENKAAHYLDLLHKADESGESLRKFKRSWEKKKAEEKKAKFDRQINEYRKSCDSGDAKVCYTFGVMFYEGQEVKQDYKEAARLFRKACDSGNAEGCYDLGRMIDDGQGVKKNHEEATRLFGKACVGGHVKGCKKYEMIQNDAKLKQLKEKQMIKLSKEEDKRRKKKAEERRKFYEENPDFKDERRKERQARKEREKKERQARKELEKKERAKIIALARNTRYRAYKAQRATKPMNFRVLAWMGDYYNYQFNYLSGSYYSIAMEQDKYMFSGYVRRNSATGRRIFEVLKDGYAHEITVKIHFPYRNSWERDQVIIDELITKD